MSGYKGILPNDDRGNIEVALQDQFTDSIIVYFNQVHNGTTLASSVSVNDRTIVVTDATGIVVGSYIILFNPILNEFSSFFVTSIASSPTINLDSPMDIPFPAGTFVDVATVDMDVDGSSTPEIFGLRGTTIPPESIPAQLDLTRIMIQCVCNSAVEFGKFGDLAILTNGLFMRKRDTRYKNILNFKSNDEMANTLFDFDILAATNPSQGVDGFKGRLTFAGSNKIGVTVRLCPGEDAEIWIQDNLVALTRLRIIAEGHIVD